MCKSLSTSDSLLVAMVTSFKTNRFGSAASCVLILFTNLWIHPECFNYLVPRLMAELHILGQIQGASSFQGESSLCCRYSFQHGPNWTIISGCPEGQTVVGKPDYYKSIIWSQPLDIHFITRGIQGWPKLILQVNCIDVVGRTWAVGYACCHIPTVPGLHTFQVPCWIPTPTTLVDRLRQHFLGGSHQLMQTDIITLGSDRYKLKTQSTGVVKVQIDIILRNFNQFGVEYK